MKSREIVSELKDRIASMETKIEESQKHSIKYNVISAFIKVGIGLDYMLPFITSTVVMWNIFNYIDKNPFSLKNKKMYANSYSMISSNGYEKEYVSYDTDYEAFDKDIEYSTAWYINDNNLYERDVTVYRYEGNDIDIYDLFNMSNEELSKTYVLSNYKKIQKSTLTEEDKIYNEETIIYNRVGKSNEFKEKDKNIEDKIPEIVLFLLHVFAYGYVGERLKFIFVKDTIADKLKRVYKKYKPIRRNEYECAKKILEIRQQNLNLISKEESRQKKI